MKMNEKERDYTTFSVPNSLIEKITDELLKDGGYRNRTDFIMDAIRRLLHEKGAL